MSVEEITEAAMKLSAEEREQLANFLLSSLDEEQDDPELKALLEGRWNEIVTGKVKTLSLDEVMEHARKQLEESRRAKAAVS